MEQPKKVNLTSKNITEETKQELKRLIPSAFKEGKIDFDALKAALGDVVEPSREFYNFTWAGKSEAFRALQRPSSATLKPCKEESKEWDKTENLFIEGDNLEVLKLLQKTYHNAVKMIYIDPPYNKDKDFVYPDRWSEGIKSYKEFCGFVDSEGNITTSEDEAKNATGRKHSRWLTMMYPRLFLARNLLKDDGVIFVSIDDDEAANLKKIMDEIFGEENFVGQIVWKKKTNGNNMGQIPPVHDYIIVYAKSAILEPILGFTLSEKYIADNYSNPDNDHRGLWTTSDLSANHKGPYFEVKNPNTGESFLPPEGRYWVFNEGEIKKRIEDGRIIFGKSGTARPVQKVFLSERKNLHIKAESWWDKHGLNEDGTEEITTLVGPKIFTHSKPTALIKHLLTIISDKNSADIVLDFFAGSGTTAHAIMALNAEDGRNRKFICVQIPEPTPENSEAKKAGYKTIAEISKERIRRAGEKVKADNPLFTGDIGFKVFKLDESNFKQWDKEITDVESLRKSLLDFADNVADGADKTDMLYELLLKKGYNLNAKVESRKIADNEIFVVDGSMLICLDDKISTATIDEIIELRPAHFIVLDKAFLGNDQLKTNTWQTFKSLFPNDENPFETV